MSGTLSDSWRIARRAFGDLREAPGLLVFPLVAALAVSASFVLFVAGTFWLPGLLYPSGAVDAGRTPVGVVLFVAAYLVSTVAAVLAQAGLTAVALRRLEGRSATTAEGWRMVRLHLGRLLLWALVAATVGLVIQLLAARFRGLGGLVLRIAAGAGWSLITYFIVPVLLFESESFGGSLRRSANLFLNTFGRTLVTNFFVGLLTAAGVLAALALGVFGFYELVAGDPVPGLTLMAVGLSVGVLVALVGATVEGILRAALYRYATTGQIETGLLPVAYRSARF